MNAIDIVLRLLGAFYVFAGIVATRVGLTSHLIDTAIAAIGASATDRTQLRRTQFLLLQSTVVLAGGLALLALLDVAVWLFLAGAAAQLAYIGLLAPHYFDRAEASDPVGRSRTINAFVLYTIATAGVVAAHAAGRLVPLAEVHRLVPAVIAALVAAQLAWIAWGLRPPRRP